MLKIYETVVGVLKKEYSKESEAFKKGAETTLKLFEIGIRTSNHFNKAIQLRELEIENRKQKSTIEHLQREVSNKKEKLFEMTLISGVPLDRPITYTIPVGGHSQTIEIITNMDSETMQACLFNFNARHTYKRPDEAKSKLLTYINNKKHYGFYAYKDLKTYKKEHLNRKK